jgi:hypothetical protein
MRDGKLVQVPAGTIQGGISGAELQRSDYLENLEWENKVTSVQAQSSADQDVSVIEGLIDRNAKGGNMLPTAGGAFNVIAKTTEVGTEIALTEVSGRVFIRTFEFAGGRIYKMFSNGVRALVDTKGLSIVSESEGIKILRCARGKGVNIVVRTQREAESILRTARPDIPWVNTYGPKVKIGAEIHIDDGSTIELPHIKWRDWTAGKSAGAEGHIYFINLK